MFSTTTRPVGTLRMIHLHRRCLRATTFAAVVLTLLGTACSDASTASTASTGSTVPQTGAIRASVQVTGGEPDGSQYTLVVDSSARTFAFAASPAVIAGLSAGPHTVTLQVTSKNCSVIGSDRLSITLPPGVTADVMFSVECKTTGIEITTHTTGLDVPSSYATLVNRDPLRTEPNGLLLVSRLAAGPTTVTLTALGDNCHVVGANPITVDVVIATVVPVVFDVLCVRIERSEKIVYEVQNTASTLGDTIRLVNPDGSGDVVLGLGLAPSWSPDGSKLLLVFSTQVCSPYDGCFATSNLAVMDPETTTIQSLLAGIGSGPAWAPSGDAIAFVGCCDPLPQIYLTRPDGSPPVKLPIKGVDGASHPTWSPDGRRIAFECFFAPATNEVCVVNRDGTGLGILTHADVYQGASDSWPAWSPDGQTIAFTMTTPTPAIAVMSADGSGLRLITDGAEPAWSRDGMTLVFVRADGLFQINADGSNLRRLTTGHHRAPAWRP